MSFLKVTIFLLVAGAFGEVLCDEEYKVNSFSLALAKDNFDEEIAKTNVLVLFYSPE